MSTHAGQSEEQEIIDDADSPDAATFFQRVLDALIAWWDRRSTS
jgi:hypothetical protein